MDRDQLESMLGAAEPLSIVQALMRTASRELALDVFAILIERAATLRADARVACLDAALALGPEAALDAFAADPGLVELYFELADRAQRAELFESLIEEEPREAIDHVYLTVRETYLDDPRLRAAASRYVRRNADRADFVDRAFLEPLRNGRADDDFREELRASFLPLGPEGAHLLMSAVRKEGLLDELLTAAVTRP
jgi:hypothetical protein